MKMKADRRCHCLLFWALLYCCSPLTVGNANEDELMDFDFSSGGDDGGVTNDNWPLDDMPVGKEQKRVEVDSNALDFAVEIEENESENRLPPFDWREKVLRNALAKALTDRELRQKFVEVMPILRVLSSQQRLALSALISAQMNAKKGHELSLGQVRMMFGDDKKLLLPIVFDLANLVKSSARKYMNLGNEVTSAELLRTPIEKRKLDLVDEELEADDTVGTIEVGGQQSNNSDAMEDFFDELQPEVLDPQLINESLQDGRRDQTATPQSKDKEQTNSRQAKRLRRAATEFVHKLIRSVPASVNEQDLLRGAAGRTIQLNTTAFQQPSAGSPPASTQTTTTSSSLPETQNYVEIENLAFAGINGTADDASANEPIDGAMGDNAEPLPYPEELISGPRYRLNKVNGIRTSGSQKVAIKRHRTQPYSRSRVKPAASAHSPVVAPPKKCERFTSNMCIRTDDYPLDQIMGSIRRHKNAMSALLAEFYDKPNNNLEFGDEFDDYVLNKKRREDEGSAGGMCQSVVRYARPQKARSASGEWKYIVNTGQHTQTLRLEKCSNPGEGCSYLAQSYRSHCSQVYNYHRLLSWDKVRGLHVDIFKVPTCCSCQVDGYRQQFPPLSSIQAKDFTPAHYSPETSSYTTINEEDLDYTDSDSDEDDLGYSPFGNSGNSVAQRDTNELYLSTKKVRSKVRAPPTVGEYLSPPDDEDQFGYLNHKIRLSSSPSSITSSSSSSKKYYSQTGRRRPQHTESRIDLDLSPSATHVADQEVKVFGPGTALTGEQPHAPPLKRKRIYSATHTATATSAAQTTAVTSNPLSGIPGAGAAFAGAVAAHAHQAVTTTAASTSATIATANAAIITGHGQGHRNYPGTFSGGKSRPRFYTPGSPSQPSAATLPSSSSNAATPLPTRPIQQQQQQHQSTALPQPPTLYHVNSIYGITGANATKRVNYNYHPIIDFFEKNRRTDSSSTSEESSEEQPFRTPASSVGAHGMGGINTDAFRKVAPTSHERRIGFGGAGGGSGLSGRVGFANDNAWHPMVTGF